MLLVFFIVDISYFAWVIGPENLRVLALIFLGSIPEAATGRTMLLCNSCMILKESQPSPAYSERYSLL